MSEVAYGPRARIDGPPPLAPRYGLLQAAEARAAEVRLVTDDVDGIERWATAEVFPYPASLGGIHIATCDDDPIEKDFDDEDELTRPRFAAMVPYMPVQCRASRVWSQEEFRSRALTSFAAIESSLVAREFMRGAVMSGQSYLADGQGEFPNGDTVTSVKNGLVLLEEAIALTGKRGVIHASPAVVDRLGGIGVQTSDGVISTTVGTIIVPDAGYAGGSQPTGKTAGEWMYATGPVDIRRSAQPFVIPDRVEEALDRGTGATRDRPNVFTWLVERVYLVVWDGIFQAAVRVDVCQDGCE